MMKLKLFVAPVALIMLSSTGFAAEIGGAGARDIGRGGNNGNNGYGNNNNYVVVPYDAGNVPGAPNSNQPVTVMNGPNGSTQTQVGTTTYYSPGGSSVTNGNRTIYSNGSNCVVQGNKKTCN
ncbi:hypothetical protein [Polynucleobacter sp. JS-Fieb-80-E5]|uniref:hypothetical protein n=1 Tax=Polynucleobacter sp. JS-Fieb-80-E5 TaxID=2081050 RepID=UPI001C0AB58C|nr:hypothetical protein [Polynucleobacter sp. JS-Fieb-80-E5]MBU3619465.1 hypothetical protein [Polynucleobacter sp. JS-Fieb-80-E5]